MDWIREEICLGSCYFAALNSEMLLTRDKKKPAKNVCNSLISLGKSLRNNYAARSLWHHSETITLPLYGYKWFLSTSQYPKVGTGLP